MSHRTPNLSDPAFEPSDDELKGLSSRAFAHLHEAQAQRLRKLREDIATARALALDRLRKLRESQGRP